MLQSLFTMEDVMQLKDGRRLFTCHWLSLSILPLQMHHFCTVDAETFSKL